MKTGSKNVIFALDPLEPELIPDERSVRWLKSWLAERRLHLEAVYVSDSDENEVGFPEFVNGLRLGDGIDIQATVLRTDSTSKKKAAEELNRYAAKIGAEFIVVSSHGRTGLNRWVMGSFAESLLEVSSVPVLFLGNQHQGPTRLKKVLLPTDFSENSKRALSLFIDEIKGFDGELILHHVEPPPGAISDTGILGVPVYVPEERWLERRRLAQQEISQVADRLKKQGFKVKTIIQDAVLDTGKAIQNVAEKEGVDLIALASTSHGMDLVMAGSVARDMVRNHHWPVWVCGPKVAA